jgi:hypothetical protein
MTTAGKARLKAVREAKDLVLNDAREIKGGKKTAAQRQAELDKLVGDNQVTQAEYASLH